MLMDFILNKEYYGCMCRDGTNSRCSEVVVVVYKYTVAESRAYSDQISDHHLRSACAMRPDRDG